LRLRLLLRSPSAIVLDLFFIKVSVSFFFSTFFFDSFFFSFSVSFLLFTFFIYSVSYHYILFLKGCDEKTVVWDDLLNPNLNIIESK
jgi:hypothetical protein